MAVMGLESVQVIWLMKMKAHHFKTINYVLFIAQELHKLVSDHSACSIFILSQLK